MNKKKQPEARRKLTELVKHGYNANQIAVELGITPNAVRLRALRAGLKLSRRISIVREEGDGVIEVRLRAPSMDVLRVHAIYREETLHQLVSKIVNIVATENMIEAVIDDR